MPELRKDPVLGRWVIISTERGKRPTDFGLRPHAARASFCPFCVGNEDQTPTEILALRDHGSPPNGPGWRVRVVPNKFPALQIEGDLNRRADGMYDKMNGIGAHEVIVEGTEHDRELSEHSQAAIQDILLVCRERMRDLKRDRRFRYIMLFKNHGEPAGASLEHAHTQLIATPVVPKRVQEELDGAQLHFRMRERCVFCDMIAQERSDGRRIISEGNGFVALAPFASRFPFETWLLPTEHRSHFEEIETEAVEPLAASLKSTLASINRALDGPAYNFVLHTSPTHDNQLEHFHWHLEIIPRLTKIAGFEWGSGFYINPTPPEDAAAFLRDIKFEAS